MAQYDINLREYWRILKKRKAIVVITAVILGFFSTSFSIIRAPTPIYTSVCSIKFDKETAVEGLYAKTLSWSGSDDMETQISIINSYSVFEKVAQKLGLIPRRDIQQGHLKSNIIRIVMGLQSKVEVSREKFTNILNIKVEDENPSFAQKLANTIALTYQELHSERQMKRTLEALKYIKEQLEDVQQKLRKAENAFNNFSQDNQLISIDLQSDNLLTRSQKTQEEIRNTQKYRMELENLSERLNRFIRDPSGSSNDFYSEKINSRYQAASATLMELLLKKDTLLEDYTPQHPEVVTIGRNIIENARKMLIHLRVEVRDADIQEIDLLNELRTIRKKTDLLMERKIEFDRRKRRVEYYRNMTALLEEKNQEALIRKAEKPEEISVVKPALLPTVPVNPPKTATTGAVGVIIGLILGLVTALVVETFDTSLGAIEDVEQTIGAPVLGVIPQTDAKEVLMGLKDKFPDGIEDLSSIIKSPHIISHFAPMSIIAESFRALRTSIQFKEADHPIKSIGITSASPQEGKTFVSLNFSITMAQAGMKVLLVGADMRKPMLSKALGLENTPGLSDILLGSYSWRDSIKTITDIIMGKIGLDGAMITPGLDNLHIITSGAIPPNPAELIESKGIGDFVKEAGSTYDIIIFDSPPILSTADAAIIATKMDSVLLVYRVGTVSRGLLKRSVTQLEQAKSHILGVVLNGMRPEISPDFHDFRYYKYDYAYTSRDEDKKQRKSFWFGGNGSRKGEAPTEDELAKGAIMDLGKPKTGKWKLPLGLAALALLVSGILWQNGMIGPFKLPGSEGLIQRGSIKPVTSKEPINDVNREGRKNGSKSISSSTSSSNTRTEGIKESTQAKPKGSVSRRNVNRAQRKPLKETKKLTSKVKLESKTKRQALAVNRSVQGTPKVSPSNKIGIKGQNGAGKDGSKSVLNAKSVSKTNDRTTEDNKKVQARPESSSLKSIAARFWKRTVKDIKTSIPSGKPVSQSKSRVAGGNERVPRKQDTTASKKGLEKTGKASNKMAKTSVPQSKSISKSKKKVLADREGVQIQPNTTPPKKVASRPQKEAAKERKTIIARSGEISNGNAIDENDEKFVWAMPETSFPKLIRVKTTKNRVRASNIVLSQSGEISKWTGRRQNDGEFVWAMHKTPFPKLIRAKSIKYRIHGNGIATPQNGSKSDPKAPIVGDEEGVQIQSRIASKKAIVSTTEAETAGFAQIPLAPSLPEETGTRDIMITGYSDKKPSYPYSLYLGSFRTEERAKRAIAVYSKNGFSAFRAKVEFRGKGVWYRVYGGHFKDEEEAYRFREKHELSEAKVRKTNYANLVGTYSKKRELRDKIFSLEEMGYSPYVIGGKNGESSILLGAYITKEGAEKQSQDLKSKGISVQVISR